MPCIADNYFAMRDPHVIEIQKKVQSIKNAMRGWNRWKPMRCNAKWISLTVAHLRHMLRTKRTCSIGSSHGSLLFHSKEHPDVLSYSWGANRNFAKAWFEREGLATTADLWANRDPGVFSEILGTNLSYHFYRGLNLGLSHQFCFFPFFNVTRVCMSSYWTNGPLQLLYRWGFWGLGTCVQMQVRDVETPSRKPSPPQ